MTATDRSHDRSAFWEPTATLLRRGADDRPLLRAIFVGSFVIVLLVTTSCGEKSSERGETAASAGSTTSMAEPSPSTPSVVMRLAVAARMYQGVVARYLALSEDPSDLTRAFGLLKPMERAFEMWVLTARTAIAEEAVQIPRDALRLWVAAFRAWLGNQSAQRYALVECADGRPINEITLIECLYTIGPLVQRGERLSTRLNALLDSEPTLADAFPELRF